MCRPQRAANSEEENLWAADHRNQHITMKGEPEELREALTRMAGTLGISPFNIFASARPRPSSSVAVLHPAKQRGLDGGHHSGQAEAHAWLEGTRNQKCGLNRSAPSASHNDLMLDNFYAAAPLNQQFSSSATGQGHPGLHPSWRFPTWT